MCIKKTSATLLIMSLLLCILISCSDSANTTQSESNTDVSSIESTAEITDDSPKLDVPKSDYNGQTFNILATVHAKYEFGTNEQTGDVVDDAIYERNVATEDYLGIDFNFIYENGLWGDKDKFCNLIKNSVFAGDGSYDLVNGITVVVMPIAGEGYFLDGHKLPYLDFSKPWWISDMYSRFSIYNLLYGFIGDASLSMYKDMSVVFFNTDILNAYKLNSPYELVRNGEWTLDNFIKIASSVKEDLNGDGNITYSDDKIGFFGEGVPCGTLQTAMELKVVDYDDKGIPSFLGLTEKYLTAYGKAYDFFMNSGTSFSLSTIDDQSFTTAKTFNNGNVFMMINFVYSTEMLREMKNDYGIIPLPKYDENQENYHTQLGTSTSMLFVPNTSADPELTSMILECLSYYSYNLVSPKYYEVALKEKYSRDSDMNEMLDIIREGATIDFIYVYGTTMTNQPNNYFRLHSDMPADLASDFAKKESSFLASLDKLISQYAALSQN